MSKAWCVVVAALALAGCGGGGTAGGEETAEGEATVRTRAVRSPEKVCLDVPSYAVLNEIKGTLVPNGYGQEFYLGSYGAVKSSDFKNVYFISVEVLDYPPQDDEDDSPTPAPRIEIGTWAVAGDLADPQTRLFSINEVAQELSDWSHGDREDANLTMNDDGARESQRCISR